MIDEAGRFDYLKVDKNTCKILSYLRYYNSAAD
jgi:hypothetical protein